MKRKITLIVALMYLQGSVYWFIKSFLSQDVPSIVMFFISLIIFAIYLDNYLDLLNKKQ